MRILLSCLQSLRPHPVPAYDFWRKYFTEGCNEAALEWAEVPGVDWVEGIALSEDESLRTWKDRTWTAVLDFVRKANTHEPISLFLSYLFPKQIEVSAIQELKRLGIPCVNFFCDNVREFRKLPCEFSAFDLTWVPEHEAIAMYENARLPYLHAPMPCWIPPQLRSVPERETAPPTFIGSRDLLRDDLFSRVISLGADLVVRGAGWESAKNTTERSAISSRGSVSGTLLNQVEILRARGLTGLYRKLQNKLFPLKPANIPASAIEPYPSPDEYFRLSREAIVTVGVNRVPTFRASNRRPLTYSRLRDIEAPMLGACYLTEATAGLSRLYEVGKEIESYRTAEELADKIDMLKQDPARRRRMRASAQQRALNEHCVPRTLERIARRLGIWSAS